MTVTISVKNNVRVKGAAYIPDVENHTGKIIPNPKWLSKDYLCLTTGDPSFPFRIINRANIVGELYAANTVSDTVFTVKSSDKKKNIYSNKFKRSMVMHLRWFWIQAAL